MDRRAFIGSVAGGLLTVPLAARAQKMSGRVPRIGLLARTSAESLSPLVDSFRQGLRDLGWVEGKSISIEYQFGDGQLSRLGELAAEAMRYKHDGFKAMKLRFGWGPVDGAAGMQRNVDLVRTVRETVGNDVDVMADAYMGWTLDYVVEPDYFKAMRIPLNRGRLFTPDDNEHSPLVVVIDEVFAHKFFPNQEPIGRRIYLDNADGKLAQIIGVVPHVKQWGLDSDDTQSLRAQLYFPFMQLPDRAMAMSASGLGVVLRSTGNARDTGG